MWAAMVLIVMLTVLSIWGAFLGAARARVLLASAPMGLCWFALVLVLGAALLAFPSLLRRPALLMTHLGCVIIILGAMAGSPAGHKVANRFRDRPRIPLGYMTIFEGDQDARVFSKNDQLLAELPFKIALKDFQRHYYEPAYVIYQTRSGQRGRFAALVGSRFNLAGQGHTVQILKLFDNLRVTMADDHMHVSDEPGRGDNAAVDLQIHAPDGTTRRRFAFAGQAGHISPQADFHFQYVREVRDYVSNLNVLEGDQVARVRAVEVNRPLHYGGYDFYQQSFGFDRGRQYTVLMVVSKQGISAVYGGFALLLLGVCVHFWIVRPRQWRRKRGANGR